VEGTLFGNGERTGNVDLVTLALNLHTQGIAPGLDLSDIDGLVRVAEHCNRLPVHPRHPYAGELVFTAFSGSHQDAIKKGLAAHAGRADGIWEVPYLPMDPHDVGRSYEAVIRINSQSGKGGVSYVLEADHGYQVPRGLAIELSQIVQGRCEESEAEVDSATIGRVFAEQFVRNPDDVALDAVHVTPFGNAGEVRLQLEWGNRVLTATGSGPLDALVHALSTHQGYKLHVTHYSQHALGQGSAAQAAAYVSLSTARGATAHGVGVDTSTLRASLAAVLVALERLSGAEGGGAVAAQ
jgi:2-isopropylmalate synthase